MFSGTPCIFLINVNTLQVATSAGSLKRQTETKHEGVSLYPCDKLECAATETCSLKRHSESYHEGVGGSTRILSWNVVFEFKQTMQFNKQVTSLTTLKDRHLSEKPFKAISCILN